MSTGQLIRSFLLHFTMNGKFDKFENDIRKLLIQQPTPSGYEKMSTKSEKVSVFRYHWSIM